MIVAYIDSSFDDKNKFSIATDIILRDDVYKSTCSKEYTNVSNGSEAEALGVYQTLKEINKLPDVREVLIYCDSESVIRQCTRLLKYNKVSQYCKYPKLYNMILTLCRGKDVRFAHQYGHDDKYNPNKICDGISHDILRRSRHALRSCRS